MSLLPADRKTDRPVAQAGSSSPGSSASLLGALFSADDAAKGPTAYERFAGSEAGRAYLVALKERKREAEQRAIDAKLMAQKTHALEVHAAAEDAKLEMAELKALERRVMSGDIREEEVRPFVEEGRQLSKDRMGSLARAKKLPPLQSWVDGISKIDQRMVDGEGGLSFVTAAPPGPGRLCRLPFYPSSDSSALSAVFFTPAGASEPMLVRSGIDEAGDDPIINLQIDPPFTSVSTSGPKTLVTRTLDYVRFRVLGVQTHEQPAYFADNATGAVAPFFGATTRYLWDAPPAITVNGLQTQNGRELFVTRSDQQLSSSTFEMLGYDSAWGPPASSLSGQLQKLTRSASRWPKRNTMFFAGLRDNPVVDNNTFVSMTAQAFVPPWPVGDAVSPPPTTRLVVPFSADLIIEMIEDQVLGDIINPSAPARAGAQVNVGVRDVGKTSDGTPLLALVAPRFVPGERMTKK